MSEHVRIGCGKTVGGNCPREAVELLLVQDPTGEWLAKPRCDKHPAGDDVALLRRIGIKDPVAVIPLPARVEVQP